MKPDPCDRCGHDWKEHQQKGTPRLKYSLHACRHLDYMDGERRVECTCDMFWPALKAGGG